MDNEKKHLNVNLDFLEDNKLTNLSAQINEDKAASSIEIQSYPSPDVRPWVRFFARYIDNFVFSFVLALLWAIFSPSSLPESDIGLGILALFLWVFVESVFLSSWGTTFGKWLLKVRVRDSEDKKLTFPVALQRSFLVWFKGLGIGFPLISIFTLISSHSGIKKTGITTWDKDCHLVVSHQKIGIIRAVVAFTLFALFLVLSFGLKN